MHRSRLTNSGPNNKDLVATVTLQTTWHTWHVGFWSTWCDSSTLSICQHLVSCTLSSMTVNRHGYTFQRQHGTPTGDPKRFAEFSLTLQGHGMINDMTGARRSFLQAASTQRAMMRLDCTSPGSGWTLAKTSDGQHSQMVPPTFPYPTNHPQIFVKG